MWLAEFLLGMFIAYYLMSRKLRRFIYELIMGIIHLFKKEPEWEYITPEMLRDMVGEEVTEKPPKVVKAKPIVARSNVVKLKTSPLPEYTDRSRIVVDEDEVEKWFRNNPELGNLNGV